MHVDRLHLPHLTLHQICGALNSAALAASVAARFVMLSAIACLLLSKPISLREVAHASHSPAPRA